MSNLALLIFSFAFASALIEALYLQFEVLLYDEHDKLVRARHVQIGADLFEVKHLGDLLHPILHRLAHPVGLLTILRH